MNENHLFEKIVCFFLNFITLPRKQVWYFLVTLNVEITLGGPIVSMRKEPCVSDFFLMK